MGTLADSWDIICILKALANIKVFGGAFYKRLPDYKGRAFGRSPQGAKSYTECALKRMNSQRSPADCFAEKGSSAR